MNIQRLQEFHCLTGGKNKGTKRYLPRREMAPAKVEERFKTLAADKLKRHILKYQFT
ncbi:MAG: hypothetical protein KUG81_05875 [Gammaproteobacteria bacterium]|nr:hypothetical protein [Gammaproteobacteria bacterium]